jgi:hypothetical protein
MSESKGWYAVTDLVPPKWTQAKVPMLGVRWLEMENDIGYLAIRYAKGRYIFEGVPRRKYEILRRHKAASVYFRAQIKEQHPCVDVKRYETQQEYLSDLGNENLKAIALEKKERLAIQEERPSASEQGLFGPIGAAPKQKRGSRHA